MATSAGGMAEQAGDSASLEALARVGLIAYGVVYLQLLQAQLHISTSNSPSIRANGQVAVPQYPHASPIPSLQPESEHTFAHQRTAGRNWLSPAARVYTAADVRLTLSGTILTSPNAAGPRVWTDQLVALRISVEAAADANLERLVQPARVEFIDGRLVGYRFTHTW